MKIVHLSLDTQNFRFDAFGPTKIKARKALVAAFKKHAQQYDLDADWWDEYADGINTTEVTIGAEGAAIRDGVQLWP